MYLFIALLCLMSYRKSLNCEKKLVIGPCSDSESRHKPFILNRKGGRNDIGEPFCSRNLLLINKIKQQQ